MERITVLHKTSDFTVIDNGIFKNPELSLPERGLLCTVLSLPGGWEFTTDGLAGLIPEGISAVKSTINKLVCHGYCEKHRVFDPKTGRIMGYDYTFFEVKNGLGCGSNPQVGFPPMDSPPMENPPMENRTPIKNLYNKELILLNTNNNSPSLSKERVSPSFDSEPRPRKKPNPQPPSLELPYESQRFREVWETLMTQPKWKGKTATALQLSLNKLSKYDEEFAISLMEDAIERNWQGVVFSDTDEKYRQWKANRQGSRQPRDKNDVNALWDR